MFSVGCDKFNSRFIDADLIKNFNTETNRYNVIVASWTNIFWHMRSNETEGVTYIVHQPTDNSRVSHLLKSPDCYIIGDGTNLVEFNAPCVSFNLSKTN